MNNSFNTAFNDELLELSIKNFIIKWLTNLYFKVHFKEIIIKNKIILRIKIINYCYYIKIYQIIIKVF